MDCHFYAFWDQTTKMVHINMNLFDDLLYAVFLGESTILHQVMIVFIET